MVIAHGAARADLLHRRLEVLVNGGILVLELDLGTALLDASEGFIPLIKSGIATFSRALNSGSK